MRVEMEESENCGRDLVGLDSVENIVRSERGLENDERDLSVEVLKAATLADRGTVGTGVDDRGKMSDLISRPREWVDGNRNCGGTRKW